MNVRPLQDRVIVRRKEELKQTAGGIVLPGSASEKQNEGEVVAVGSGRVLDNGTVKPIDVKVGDIVVFGQYAGTNILKYEGKEFIILEEGHLLAVLGA